MKTELIQLNEEVVNLKEETRSNIENFLNWAVISKAEMLKEIKNRLDFIDKIIMLEEQEKYIYNDKLNQDFFSLLIEKDIEKIRYFLTERPINLNLLIITEEYKDGLKK